MRCCSCKSIFDEGRAQGAYLPVLKSWEERCPYCGSSELEEVGLCLQCGKPAPREELREGLCPECGRQALKRLRALLAASFSEPQVAFLAKADWF